MLRTILILDSIAGSFRDTFLNQHIGSDHRGWLLGICTWASLQTVPGQFYLKGDDYCELEPPWCGYVWVCVCVLAGVGLKPCYSRLSRILHGPEYW